MDYSGDRLVSRQDRVEMPPSVVRRHPLAFAIEAPIARITGSPAPCHLAVDPQIDLQDDAIMLLRVPTEEIILARVRIGRQKVMLCPIDDENTEDLLYSADEIEPVGTVVWWQAAYPPALT